MQCLLKTMLFHLIEYLRIRMYISCKELNTMLGSWCVEFSYSCVSKFQFKLVIELECAIVADIVDVAECRYVTTNCYNANLLFYYKLQGFAQTPLLTSKRFSIHPLTIHFKCPTVWKWSTSLVLLLRITAVQTSLVVLREFVHRGPARNMCISCSCCWDERTCINTCINTSQVRAPKSCP